MKEQQHENVSQLEERITQHKLLLDAARYSGDPLRIELAESGLNDLLDRLSQLSHVTPKESA